MQCPHCQSTHTIKNGKTNKGVQRYRCKTCDQGFTASDFHSAHTRQTYHKPPPSYPPPPDNPDSYSDWPLLPLPLILFSISLFLGVIVFVRHSPSLFFLTVALCLVLYWMPTSLRFLFRMLTAPPPAFVAFLCILGGIFLCFYSPLLFLVSAVSVCLFNHYPSLFPFLLNSPRAALLFLKKCSQLPSFQKVVSRLAWMGIPFLWLTIGGTEYSSLAKLFVLSLPFWPWNNFKKIGPYLLTLNKTIFFQTQLRREYLTSDTSTLVPHLQPQWTKIGSRVAILFSVLAINFSPLLGIALVIPLLLSFALAILHDNPSF